MVFVVGFLHCRKKVTRIKVTRDCNERIIKKENVLLWMSLNSFNLLLLRAIFHIIIDSFCK
jgi:hypothetical protein